MKQALGLSGAANCRRTTFGGVGVEKTVLASQPNYKYTAEPNAALAVTQRKVHADVTTGRYSRRRRDWTGRHSKGQTPGFT